MGLLRFKLNFFVLKTVSAASHKEITSVEGRVRPPLFFIPNKVVDHTSLFESTHSNEQGLHLIVLTIFLDM